MIVAVPGVLKSTPRDFLVSESLVLRAEGAGRFTYVRLRKQGFTTFEAVERIAGHFGVQRQRVAFAGLKDEDGITEQTLALELRVSEAEIARFNEAFARGDTSMSLYVLGSGDDPVVTGQLEGNAFRIVVRDLDAAASSRLRANHAIENYFLNYYDTQRFGVPGGPKLTHEVGRALLAGDHAAALALVRELRSPESARAARFDGHPRDFFERADPRVVSFYYSSAESADWNRRLGEELRAIAGAEVFEVREHGVGFVFADRAHVLRLLASRGTLGYRRYRAAGDAIVSDESTRPTVVPTRVRCLSLEDDELSPGRRKAELTFFLPSGCYATMCVKALLLRSH